jgi:hypothetical protein
MIKRNHWKNLLIFYSIIRIFFFEFIISSILWLWINSVLFFVGHMAHTQINRTLSFIINIKEHYQLTSFLLSYSPLVSFLLLYFQLVCFFLSHSHIFSTIFFFLFFLDYFITFNFNKIYNENVLLLDFLRRAPNIDDKHEQLSLSSKAQNHVFRQLDDRTRWIHNLIQTDKVFQAALAIQKINPLLTIAIKRHINYSYPAGYRTKFILLTSPYHYIYLLFNIKII